MSKIKNFLYKIFYSLPFGLKGADSEIMGSGGQDVKGTEISQEVSDERVGKHLIKGEVTQEVEELRYRTYAVAEKSKDYDYLGNGVSIKKEEKNDTSLERIKFTQENGNLCETVLDTLKQVGSYGIEKYRVEINYNFFIRFKLEKYITKIDVDIDEKKGKINTVLHFNTEHNPYDATSKPFINELKKLLGIHNQYEIERNEIASSIKDMSFTTYKADNEDDFTSYSFINGGKFVKFEVTDYEYLMTLEWSEYIRLPLNLESKYYSKTMAEKYERKEKKDAPIEMVNSERKAYCSICGKEMSVYDADIQKVDGGEPICTECLKKILKK